MTGVDVEHTKALEAAATPGPWTRNGDFVIGTIDGDTKVLADYCWTEADAAFIAHARTAVPALVAAVERVQALHEHVTVNTVSYCRVCLTAYPCSTIRELETP
ncbi:hypothetical protein RCF19_30055 [Rhodococcus qingshengii]